MTAVTVSTIGTIRNSPGPFTPCSLPARRITNRCQLLAIFSEVAINTASTPKAVPGTASPASQNPKAISSKRIVKNTVIGFMRTYLPRARSPQLGSPADWIECFAPCRQAIPALTRP